jgi:predicted metal-dependent enzyme (double-stranded beta helix superfamily)
MMPMFDLDQFLIDCLAARSEAEPRQATREVLRKTMADAGSVADVMRPAEGGISLLHHEPDLTVIHVVWAPGMQLFPHDHRMWAAIGIYAGQEDNAFFRRDRGTITPSGGKELDVGDVLVLGADAVHAVANSRDRLAGAIHVYGGDFVNEPRSQFDPETLEERPFSMEAADAEFERANRAWAQHARS